jgi:hypothetical protein
VLPPVSVTKEACPAGLSVRIYPVHVILLSLVEVVVIVNVDLASALTVTVVGAKAKSCSEITAPLGDHVETELDLKETRPALATPPAHTTPVKIRATVHFLMASSSIICQFLIFYNYATDVSTMQAFSQANCKKVASFLPIFPSLERIKDYV